MLYKNDEQYKLTANDIREVKKQFPKFPVRITYPEERVRPSLSKHNRLPDKPNSISFPLVATVKSTTGSDVWRYAENRMMDNKGGFIYLPPNFFFTGTYILHETDIELVWYLWTKCPYTFGGLNYNGIKPKVVFEDLIGKAERKAEAEAKAADVKALIYSSKVGLPESKLRTVAKAFFIPDVDEMTFAQVKVSLENEITRDRKNGVQKFLDMIDNDDYLDVRATLQAAMDRNLIKFIPQKKTWAWAMGPGRKPEPIVEITASADPNEALMTYYRGNKKFAQSLEASLKGNQVIIGEGSGSPDDDEEEQ